MQLDYLDQHSQQTLRDALAELRAAEGEDKDASAHVAPDLSQDLDIHDAIHVVFGCSTDVRGEVLAHVWTLLGTTAKVRDLHRVMSHRDHREALSDIGHLTLVSTWIASLPAIATVIVKTLAMREKLPVENLHNLLDRPLGEIRRRYGIQLLPGSRRDRGGAAVRRIHQRRFSPPA